MTIILSILLIAAAFCAFMISRHDWRSRIIPDVYLFPLMLIGLLVVTFFPWLFDVGESVIAATIGYMLGIIVGLVFKKKSPEAIGLGDVKLLAVGGIWLGVTGLAIALLASSIIGGIWGLIKKKKFIPFAPFFFTGAICSLIAMLFLI